MLSIQLKAQSSQPTTRILFVLDASASMLERWERFNKWEVAEKALVEVMDSFRHVYGVEFGLRVYGDQHIAKLRNCEDTRLAMSFSPTNEERIKMELQKIYPRGITPIAYALEKCANDFPKGPNARNIVILITDGNEVCDGDPCAISKHFQKKNIFLRPFIIAMNIPDEHFYTLECIGVADNVKKEEDFAGYLNDLVKRTMSETTAQVDLLDVNGQALETNVNITFFNKVTDKVTDNLYHTMNAYGVPDTIYLEATNDYDLTIHTYPPLYKDTVELKPARHNHIPIKAAQGDLIVKVSGMSEEDTKKSDLKYILREYEQNNIIHIQDLNVKTKYLVGTYDIEVLTLPRVYIRRVDVSQVRTTTLEIPAPGLAKVTASTKGVGGIFMINEKGQLEKIYEFEYGKPVRESLYLQPGSYMVMYRKEGETRSINTIEKTFTIESNQTLNINLY
jgi:Ca-activated chloride channel family protein